MNSTLYKTQNKSGKHSSGKAVGNPPPYIRKKNFPILVDIKPQKLVSIKVPVVVWIRILAMLSVNDLIKFSQCCKISNLIVHIALVKSLKPFIKQLGTINNTNIHFWMDCINQILWFSNNYKCIKRSENAAFSDFLNKNYHKNMICVDNIEAGQYYGGVSYDDLPASHIVFCVNEKPARHTSNMKYLLRKGSFYCNYISLGQFLVELKKRCKIKVTNHVASIEPIRHNEYFQIYTFYHMLLILFKLCESKDEGKVIMRKIEYFFNNGIQINHRIWIQLAVGWPKIEGAVDANDIRPEKASINNYNNQLFLTLYDHYLWIQ